MGPASIGRAGTFAGAACRYWLEVFPSARRELRHWRRLADGIPDPALRAQALLAQQTKNGNAEGLAAYAVLAPRGRRRQVVRALVAYQTTLDYLDTITDPPGHPDELKLHGALRVAVDREWPLDKFRAEIAGRGDRDYLEALVTSCRASLGALPSYPGALAMLRRRARLGADSQEMNHSLLLGADEPQLAEWAIEVGRATGLGTELWWWETFAAGASTPAIGALVATAAHRGAGEEDLAAIERAYFPWVNALNTLLDNLVDLDEDPSELRHIERYGSMKVAAERLGTITARARAAVGRLPSARQHELILAAMAGYYLAQPAAWRGDRRAIAAAVREESGPFAGAALAVHRLRQRRSESGAGSPAPPRLPAVLKVPAAADRSEQPGSGGSPQRTWQARTTVAASSGAPAKK